MSIYSDMINEILIRGNDDWVDDAEIAWVVNSIGNINNDKEIIKISIQLIKELLINAYMVVGELTEKGFKKWEITDDEAIKRIEKEWSELNRLPTPGEICWFCNTEKGDEIANILI